MGAREAQTPSAACTIGSRTRDWHQVSDPGSLQQGGGTHRWAVLWRVLPWAAGAERSELDLGLEGEQARVAQGATWNLSSRLSSSSLGACANAHVSPAGQAPVSCGARENRWAAAVWRRLAGWPQWDPSGWWRRPECLQ